MDVCVFVKVDVIITGEGGGWLITRRIRIISKLYRKSFFFPVVRLKLYNDKN